MTPQTLEWTPLESSASVPGLIAVALKEVRRHAALLAAIFAGIALIALALGLFLPKKYAASTTILVEQGNIIAPLMEGRAVATGVANRAAIAKEVAFSRKVMNQILKTGGWLASNPEPIQRDKLIDQIKDRTWISNPAENLISIIYVDSDPQRAYEVTTEYARLVIHESLANKEQESRDAFQFIDSQVEQYRVKLTDAELRLEKYREQNPDARTGIASEVANRVGELNNQLQNWKMDLADLRSQERSIQSQLSGENEISMVRTRAGQIEARLAEMQSEREHLLLTYTEQYPDVVRIQHQIQDLQEDLKTERTRQESRIATDPTSLGQNTTYNPLYAELRSKLADIRRQSAAIASRIATGEQFLGTSMHRSEKISESESKLAELTRDYEVNRDLYQDLLKRRENARVSMNLDAEHRGLTFSIQEPATVPLRASGLRTLHVAGAGLLLAVLAPFGLLFGRIKLDPRVRSQLRIEREARLPVLGVMPVYRSESIRATTRRNYLLATAIVGLVLAAYAATFYFKVLHG